MTDIFISYSNKDEDFVSRFREALVNQGLEEPWQDFRHLKGGDSLEDEIFQAIESAKYYILIVSSNMFSSAWVAKEAHFAARIKERSKNDFRIIPLVLDDTDLNALKWIFSQEELAAIRIKSSAGGIAEAMPAILAALELQLPNVPRPVKEVKPEPLEELFLQLSDPYIKEEDGKRRAVATAELTYNPAQAVEPPVKSRRFNFIAPLGPIEMEDLKWYLERYYIWPAGIFKDKAGKIEKKLPDWGKEIYKNAMPESPCLDVLKAWDSVLADSRRCFTVYADSELLDASKEEQNQAKEAATLLLSLPWELLHDGEAFLFQGKKAVRVRRQLPNYEKREIIAVSPPVRILMVSPRPEDKAAGYIDHRVSALPLVQALETLGEFAEITVLCPPTFPALATALQRAQDSKKPFHVVHFDGHGVYQKDVGLGGLCFEDPDDAKKLEKRKSQVIGADKIAEIMRDYRIPVVFLEACQSAQAELDPIASVATALLSKGVASVIAMTHSVLVETARRFVTAFYQALVAGTRVGEAMLLGQQALKNDTFRAKIFGAGRL
ncbi:MAG: CHAT domain-containing protein, partial [Desulfobacteraceae bacterium]|nr:CHAT domain-containing protein [Desulfobacteraceae bacterium]